MAMTNRQFDEAINASIARIETLPHAERQAMMKMVEVTKKRYEKICTNTKSSLDTLDDFRLWAKYTLFDQEARTREAAANRTEDSSEDITDPESA